MYLLNIIAKIDRDTKAGLPSSVGHSGDPMADGVILYGQDAKDEFYPMYQDLLDEAEKRGLELKQESE